MNTTLLTIAVAFLGASSLVAADKPKIVAASPTNGVFFIYGWHKTVIELKDGKFRYWFWSDLGGSYVEGLEGTYTTEGDKIVLKHQKLIPLMSNWTVRSINGVVTLWSSDGCSSLKSSRRTAEETWKSPQIAGLSDADYKRYAERRKREAELIREGEQAIQDRMQAIREAEQAAASDGEKPSN
jgi:hypothetical protein